MRIRTGVSMVAVLAVVLGVGGYAVWRVLGHQLPLRLPAAPSCVVQADGQVTLGVDQMANAATISAVGIRRGLPEQAIVVALATALQESKLRNLPGGDRDSVGLFQQRPSQGWGTPEQIADPRYAANVFYTSLLKVHGWQDMRITDAAQAVQRSAHPEAYDKWGDEAGALARAFTGTVTSAVACTVDGQPAQRGVAAAQALATGLRLDWGEAVATAAAATPPGVTLPVRDQRAGWQYAHWLVAHAEEQGVKRVRYASQEWTAKSGSWTRVPNDRATGERVTAEVYGDTDVK